MTGAKPHVGNTPEEHLEAAAEAILQYLREAHFAPTGAEVVSVLKRETNGGFDEPVVRMALRRLQRDRQVLSVYDPVDKSRLVIHEQAFENEPSPLLQEIRTIVGQRKEDHEAAILHHEEVKSAESERLLQATDADLRLANKIEARARKSELHLQEHVREQLKEWFELSGLSQAEIARRAGIDVSALNRSMNGHRPVTLTQVERLAVALGLGMDLVLVPHDERNSLPKDQIIRKALSGAPQSATATAHALNDIAISRSENAIAKSLVDAPPGQSDEQLALVPISLRDFFAKYERRLTPDEREFLVKLGLAHHGRQLEPDEEYWLDALKRDRAANRWP